MNLVKIRKEADISRNANAKIINFTSDSARWIEDNMYTSRFIKYLMLNSLLFNVSIDYILGISEFKVLNNNERKYLINKLNIDENKLTVFQVSTLNKKYIENINAKNIKINLDKTMESIIKKDDK
jgi:hypothetical protein